MSQYLIGEPIRIMIKSIVTSFLRQQTSRAQVVSIHLRIYGTFIVVNTSAQNPRIANRQRLWRQSGN